MEAIILAAGRGTRMRPLSDAAPKPMLPVAGRPIAAHVADAAVAAGAEKLVFVVGYRPEAVTEYFGDEFEGVPVEYATQETRAGTADAVAAAIDYVEGPFAVLNGDNVYRTADLAALFERVPAVGYTVVDNPEEYGVVSMDGDTVTDIVEKPADPPANTANTGAYAFPESVRDSLHVPESERGERELTDVLERLIDVDTVSGIEFEEWADIGYPWDLLEANEQALGDIERDVRGDVHADADLRGNVVVEEGASVDAGVVIEGPALVRSGASVGPNAYVRGRTVLGEDVQVGHGVEIKNSVLMRDASANHLSYVGDSLVGPAANLGAGTITANHRHDEAAVRAGDDKHPTGREKFGAVVGPGARTGANTSFQPGAVLDADAWTAPGDVVESNH